PSPTPPPPPATPMPTIDLNGARYSWRRSLPRFGDGVDVLIGAGRKQIYDQTKALGKDVDQVARDHTRPIHDSLQAIPADNLRPIAVLEKAPSVPEAAHIAIKALSKNKKGYFLMIEWDAHTDNPRTGLDAIVGFDKLIREIASTVNLKDT